MARLLAFDVALVGLAYLFAGEAGCNSISNSTNESGSNACVGDASVRLIQASNYDQSCKVDTDCWQIAEGNTCASCGLSCPGAAAINLGALAQYNSDIANTPGVGQGCVVLCPGAVGPCCVNGTCQTNEQCQAPVSPMTCTLGAACSSTDICGGGSR